MFVLLHYAVTKSQGEIPNFSVLIFVVIAIQLKKRQPGFYSFQTPTITKIQTENFGISHLVFSHQLMKPNKN
jgi:hypothetical protein